METRRNLPILMLMGCFIALYLSACSDDFNPATAVPSPTVALIQSPENPDNQTPTDIYQEAPTLAQQVAQGDLPPVAERLPATPMLLQPESEVGVYGGVLHVPVSRVERRFNVVSYEPLLRWDPQWLRAIPNVAQVVESSEDATTYTFHLRRGMRWSDGAPFTADDILFWYEDVFANATLTPRQPGWLSAGGVPVTVEKIDDHTVTFRFTEPNSLFLLNLAGSLGEAITRYPRHYLEQFHVNHDPDAARRAGEAGAADWAELFQRQSRFTNPDLPVLHAWVVREIDDGRITAERNPYYWKVDTAFNQLPYLDRVVFTERGLLTADDLPRDDNAALLFFPDDFAETPDVPDFTAVTLISNYSANLVIGLNLNHSDPARRDVFQNHTFRRALSHAINRPEMIDDFFGGAGEAYQPAPRPESPYYNEQLARQFTAYDVALANSLLDEAGYAARDEAGYRLGPDGRRITIRLQSARPAHQPFLRAVQSDWEAVGIETPLLLYDEVVAYNEALFANRHDTFVSDGAGGLNVLLQPVFYLPLHPFASWYASGWGQWFVDPADPAAIEPPPATQRQMTLYKQLKATSDAAEQEALMTQILEIAAAEFYVMGLVLDPNSRLLISPNLRNVPVVMPLSIVDYSTPSPSNPAQYFIRSPE